LGDAKLNETVDQELHEVGKLFDAAIFEIEGGVEVAVAGNCLHEGIH
jgi:hypothetical protein